MRSKLLAAALILLTVLGTSGSWHLESDDPDFLPAARHDHSTHHEVFNIPTAPDGGGHCAICHWLQTFRASAVRHARVQFASPSRNARVVSAIPLILVGALFDVPSRAPPA